jgi:hypothetical protein
MYYFEYNSKLEIDKIRILERYNFEEGNFSIYILLLSNEQILKNNAKYIYSDSKRVLQKIKEEWIFRKKASKTSRCEPNLLVYITNNDSIVEYFRFNIDKSNIAIFNENYLCTRKNFFSNTLNTFKEFYKYEMKFVSLEQRRNFLKKNKNCNLVLKNINSGKYIKYDKIIRFSYSTKRKSGLYYKYLTDTIKNKFADSIKAVYPHEDFLIDCSFSSYNHKNMKLFYLFDIYCNSSLFKKFELYPTEGFNSEYFIPFVVYSKKELPNISVDVP